MTDEERIEQGTIRQFRRLKGLSDWYECDPDKENNPEFEYDR